MAVCDGFWHTYGVSFGGVLQAIVSGVLLYSKTDISKKCFGKF